MSRCKGNRTKSAMLGKMISLLTVLALTLMCVPSIPSLAAEVGDAEVYIAAGVDSLQGIINNWESTEMPDAEMNSGVKNQFSNAGWFDIKTDSGNYWKAAWDTQANHRYNINDGTVTVQYPSGQSAESWEAFSMEQAVSAANVKYVVIGVNSNVSTTRVRMYACTDSWDDGGSNRSAGLNIKQGYNEIICPVSEANQPWAADNTIYKWDNSLEIARLKFTADANLAENIELTFDYVRFITDDYNGYLSDADETGTLIQNGAEDYAVENNVLDFVFLANLNLSTATTSNVTINNAPAAKVITSANVPYVIRVNLGKLRNNQTYTIRFNGVKTEDGEDITGEFTFTTPYVPPEKVTPDVYLPPAADAGVVGGWESTETPKYLNDDGSAAMYDQVKNQFGRANWYPIPMMSGTKWFYGWYSSVMHKYNTETGTVSLQYRQSFKDENNDANPEIELIFGAPVPAGNVKYLVLGINSEKDENIQIKNLGSQFGVDLTKGFREYVIPLDLKGAAEINKIGFGHSYNTFDPFVIEISYVRLASEVNLHGDKIENGAQNYDINNNVIDLVFPYNLNMDLVDASKITVNGQPVKSLIKTGAKDSFRVDLGKLKKNMTYTIAFSGIEKEDETVIEGEFSVTTPYAENIKAAPVMHKADTASFIGGWECSETLNDDVAIGQIDNFSNAGWYPITTSSGTSWKYGWYTSIEHRYDTNGGTVSLRVSPQQQVTEEGGDTYDANPDTSVTFGTPVNGAAAKYVIFGMDSSVDESLTVYLTQDKNDEAGLAKLETPVVLNIKKGFHEYVLPFSLENYTQIDSIRFSHRPTGFSAFELQFSYIRFADENYKGMGEGDEIAYTPFMEYDSDNAIVDFVFPAETELDFETVTTENVTLNGAGAEYILTDSTKPNVFRAYFSSMTPMTRCRLNITDVQNTNGDDIAIDEYRFTTGTKEDTTGKSSPIMSWELVENYRTADEALLTADTALAGKTVTAVTGGLYNNSDVEKTYALMIALYKDDVLEGFKVEEKTLGAYATVGEQTVQMDVPDDGNTYTLKAFAWDYTTLVPLCRAVTQADSTASKPLKVLILGNSITQHAPVKDYGWFGHWGMAASSQDKDYVHQLINSVKPQYPTLQVRFRNIAQIENRFYENISPQVQESIEFREGADYNADIIIITIGANIHNENGHTFDKEKFGEIINTFKTNPNAKVIIGSTTLTGDDVKEVLSGYAADNNMQFVDMSFTRTEHPEYFPADDDYLMLGVCLHPNDAGMKVMADSLAPELRKAIETYHAN